MAVVHPPRDGLVLAGAERRELAGATLRVGGRDLDAAADILAVVRQEAQMGKEFLAGSLRPCLQAKAYLTEIRGLRR